MLTFLERLHSQNRTGPQGVLGCKLGKTAFNVALTLTELIILSGQPADNINICNTGKQAMSPGVLIGVKNRRTPRVWRRTYPE
jgi:hypothetical protein